MSLTKIIRPDSLYLSLVSSQFSSIAWGNISDAPSSQTALAVGTDQLGIKRGNMSITIDGTPHAGSCDLNISIDGGTTYTLVENKSMATLPITLTDSTNRRSENISDDILYQLDVIGSVSSFTTDEIEKPRVDLYDIVEG